MKKSTGYLGLALLVPVALLIASCGVYDRAWKGFFCVLSLGDCECIYNENSESCKVDANKGNSPDDPALPADCICRLSKHDVQVFFANKPNIYKTFPDESVHIYAGRCDNINVCPEPVSFITGNIYATIDRWHEYDDWIGEGDFWYFDGTLTDKDGNILSENRIERTPGRVSIMLASAAGAVNISASPLNCEEECKTNSIYCTKVTGEGVGSERAVSMRSLYYEMKNSIGGRVQIQEIMRMFSIEEDPCSRGDMYLEDGIASNVGGSCDLDHEIDFGLGAKVGIQISVPHKVEAALKNEGESLRFIFEDEGMSGVLKISDDRLNQNYGGLIKEIIANNRKALFSTETGCIAVSYW